MNNIDKTQENPYTCILIDEKFLPTVAAVQEALRANNEAAYDLRDATFMTYCAIADLVDCEIAAGGAALEDEEVNVIIHVSVFKFAMSEAASLAVCAAVKSTFWCAQ